MSQTSTSNGSETEPEKIKGALAAQLSLGKLLSTLTPSQLWGLIGVVCIILSGAFGLGYKVKSTIAQVDTGKLQVEITNLKTGTNNLRQKSDDLLKINKELEAKERFLTLYIRYMDAEKAWKKATSDQGLVQKRKEAARVLNSFVREQLSQSSKNISNKSIPVMRAGMGRTRGETVIVFNDGTKWALPYEVLHFATTCWLCP